MLSSISSHKSYAVINARSKNKNTPLQLACQKGHTNIVKILLSNEALNKDPRDENDFTPLMQACFHGHMTIVEYLINKGCDINARSKNKMTPLHFACLLGHKSIAELLLSKGADDKAENDNGETPLDFTELNNLSISSKSEAEEKMKNFNEKSLTNKLLKECDGSMDILIEIMTSKTLSIKSTNCLHEAVRDEKNCLLPTWPA